jgi:hypothetical protein
MAVKVASPKAAVRMAVLASSATGAPGRSATDSALGDCWTRGGVAKARRAQRGKVITEAETSSFPGDSPSASNKRPYGFWKTFWGKDHNEAKDFAPIVWRVLSCLPYLIPCMGAIAFTDQAFMTFPMTFKFAILMSPLLQVFYSNSFIPFVTFFTLFLAVVRNVKLNHFLRYNTMQAILLDICVMLAGLIMQYLPMYITTSAIGSLLECFILINALFAIFYCQWNVVQGIYPEIPIITEAVYAQVRDV